MCPLCGTEWSIYNIMCDACNIKQIQAVAPELIAFVEDATDYQITGASNGVVFDGPIPVRDLPLVLTWLQDEQ